MLYGNGCPWNHLARAAAARGGHLEMLWWVGLLFADGTKQLLPARLEEGTSR